MSGQNREKGASPSTIKRILVTYATLAGSTAEVAQVVGEQIAISGLQVDVIPLSKVTDIGNYDAVVVGGPMIMGWHRAALGFLKEHSNTFQRVPLAVFILAMSLTKNGGAFASDPTVTVDEELPKPPLQEGKLNFRERYARLDNYLRPIIQAVRPSRPVSIGVFGGRLEYGRLKWWAVLFAMLIIQAPAGDRRNWSVIRKWAAELPETFRARSKLP